MLNAGDEPRLRDARLTEWLARQSEETRDRVQRAMIQVDPEAPTMPDMRATIPELPKIALLPPAIAHGACEWLDAFVAFSRKWSPRSFDGFHEAVGLWVLSTVAARRVKTECGGPRFTPLFVALIAPTSIGAKSEAARNGRLVLEASGLEYLLLPEDMTSARFLHELVGEVPRNFGRMSEKNQAKVKLRLAHSGQRGWFYDEMGQSLAGITREGGPGADFHSILRRIDGCPTTMEKSTMARGTEQVELPYLAMLGSLTPADIRSMGRRGNGAWTDGFWARFALIAPNTDAPLNVGAFPRGEKRVPDELIIPLQEWDRRLGSSHVTIDAETNSKGKVIGYTFERQGHPPQLCQLDNDAWDAYCRYGDALLELIHTNRDEEAIAGNYNRLQEKALRMAVMFASLAGSAEVKLQHWALAQQIAERWRANLHHLIEILRQEAPSRAQQLEKKILSVLARHQRSHSSMTAADIRRYIKGPGIQEIVSALEAMVRGGEVSSMKGARTVHYRLEVVASDQETSTGTSVAE
jgi:ribosomal protein L18E